MRLQFRAEFYNIAEPSEPRRAGDRYHVIDLRVRSRRRTATGRRIMGCGSSSDGHREPCISEIAFPRSRLRWSGGAASAATGAVDPSTLEKQGADRISGLVHLPRRRTTALDALVTRRADARDPDHRHVPGPERVRPDELCAVPGMTIGGKPAYLFSSRNPKTVSRHFRWMKEYGLDGVLVQRFVGEIARKRADGDMVLKNIMAAADDPAAPSPSSTTSRAAIPDTFAQMLKDDWTYLVDETQSHRASELPAAQRQAGGVGVGDGARRRTAHPPADAQVAKDLIEWFKRIGASRIAYLHGRHAFALADADGRFARRIPAGPRSTPRWTSCSPGPSAATERSRRWTSGRKTCSCPDLKLLRRTSRSICRWFSPASRGTT